VPKGPEGEGDAGKGEEVGIAGVFRPGPGLGEKKGPAN